MGARFCVLLLLTQRYVPACPEWYIAIQVCCRGPNASRPRRLFFTNISYILRLPYTATIQAKKLPRYRYWTRGCRVGLSREIDQDDIHCDCTRHMVPLIYHYLLATRHQYILYLIVFNWLLLWRVTPASFFFSLNKKQYAQSFDPLKSCL